MPRLRARRQWRIGFVLALLALWMLAAGSAAQAAASAQLQRQREQFARAYALAQQGDPAWRRDAEALQDYPLYPYLEAAYLLHDLGSAHAARVRDYLARHGALIPGRELRRAWLDRLARKQDWQQYLAFYAPGLGATYDCRELQAQAMQGGTLTFDGAFAALWDAPRLPDACAALLQLANTQGLLTPERLWDRIQRAVRARAAGTLTQTLAWLPVAQQPGAQRLALALSDPAGALAQAGSWPDTGLAREAMTLALTRRARDDDDAARAAWQALRGRFELDAVQVDRIEAALALYQAVSLEPGSLRALAALPATAQTPLTREWRARVALAQGDWPAVLAAIRAMPAAQREAKEWRYFEARALAATGARTQADALWRALARDPTYYGFLAADRVQRPYALCPRDPPAQTAATAAVAADPGMQRAFEWYALHRLTHARREWNAALPGLDHAQRYAAVVLAHRRGWVDRAIFLLNHGDYLRDYKLRFPLAERARVVRDAHRAGIDPAWAFAIIRTESAWISDARSGADARGLMQLLPGTAAQLARRNGLPWEGAASLDDPSVNIALGTHYLQHLADRFGAQWLASAAYNAGPAALQDWMAKRATLPADVFVATIPYPETRGYVESTLAFSVIYDWRLHQDPVRLSARMLPFGGAYAVPDAQAPRAAVVCSVEDLAAQGDAPPPSAASTQPAPSASVHAAAAGATP